MKFKAYRELRRLTRPEASVELDVDHATVWRWEEEGRVPEPAMLRKITAWSEGAVTANDFIGTAPAGGGK